MDSQVTDLAVHFALSPEEQTVLSTVMANRRIYTNLNLYDGASLTGFTGGWVALQCGGAVTGVTHGAASVFAGGRVTGVAGGEVYVYAGGTVTDVTAGKVHSFSGGTVRLGEGVRLEVGDNEARTTDGSLVITGYVGKPFTLFAADGTQLYPRQQ